MAGIFLDDYGDNTDAVADGQYQAEEMVSGQDVNTFPTQGDRPEYPSDTPSLDMRSVTDVIGKIGAAARDIGTAVGTTVRAVKQAPINYKRAYNNAATGNSFGQWWQYASPGDKAMVVIGVVGLFLALRK